MQKAVRTLSASWFIGLLITAACHAPSPPAVKTPVRIKIIISSAALLLTVQTYALPQSLTQGPPKVHRHVTLLESVLETVRPEFSMVATSPAANSKKENLVTNRTRTYDAFTAPDTRLFVKDRQTGKVFEIRGLPLEWRPFSDLIWQNSHTLVFDRWSQPHFGVHYAVDVKRKRLITAKPFPDEFYLEQQRPGKPRR